MKRRVFLRNSAFFAGLLSTLKLSFLFPESRIDSEKSSLISNQSSTLLRKAQEDIRSTEYLRRVKKNKFLTKPPGISGIKIDS